MIKIQYDDERGNQVYENIYEMFFENLKYRKVDFNELMTLYVKFLQTKEDSYKKQLSEIDMPLIDYIFNGKLKEKDKQIKDCAIRYLVKYKRFEKAPIFEELKQHIENNNININGDYYMDLYNSNKE